MAKKELNLQEKDSVGGGETGKYEVPDPVGGTATLPNSKNLELTMWKIAEHPKFC